MPLKFRGIREYIRKCNQTQYYDEPNYDVLHQIIGQMFEPVKEVIYAKILKPMMFEIKQNVLRNYV